MFNFFKKKSQLAEEKIKEEEKFDNILPIQEYLYKKTGITFENQESILISKVKIFCKKHEIYSFETLLSKVRMQLDLDQELINHITTNETYFYREFKQIEKLCTLVKEKNNPVSIICAPSATGEEPYSIAIALLEANVPASHINIVGIDINSEALEKSKKALYSKLNVRNLSEDILQKHFTKKNDLYELKENVKSLVHFELRNIFDASFHTIGKFDFVFSRNMLIYFDKETKQKAKEILQALRKEDTNPVFFGHADLF